MNFINVFPIVITIEVFQTNANNIWMISTCSNDCSISEFWPCTRVNSSIPVSDNIVNNRLPKKPYNLMAEAVPMKNARFLLNIYWFHHKNSETLLKGFSVCLTHSMTNETICNEMSFSSSSSDIILTPFNLSCFIVIKSKYSIRICSLPTNSINCEQINFNIKKATRYPEIRWLGSVQLWSDGRNLNIFMWAEDRCGSNISITLCEVEKFGLCDSSAKIVYEKTTSLSPTTHYLREIFFNLTARLYCVVTDFEITVEEDDPCDRSGMSESIWPDNKWKTYLDYKIYENQSLEVSFTLPGDWYEFSTYNITLYFREEKQCLLQYFKTVQIKKPKNGTKFDNIPSGEYCIEIVPHNERINKGYCQFICCKSDNEPIACPAAKIYSDIISVPDTAECFISWKIILSVAVAVILIISIYLIHRKIVKGKIFLIPSNEVELLNELVQPKRVIVLNCSDVIAQTKEIVKELREKTECIYVLSSDTESFNAISQNVPQWIINQIEVSDLFILIHSSLAENIYFHTRKSELLHVGLHDHIFSIFIRQLKDVSWMYCNKILIHICFNYKHLNSLARIGGQLIYCWDNLQDREKLLQFLTNFSMGKEVT